MPRFTLASIAFALAAFAAPVAAQDGPAVPVSATDPGVVRVGAQVLSPGTAWEVPGLLRAMAERGWVERRAERAGVVVVNPEADAAGAPDRPVRVEVHHLAN